ncbi:MAG: CotH kinase family protein, partial [Oscillospiraceae bacterium]|nr:CotH kinase family protein [Oscillospiraceae bacterium]
MTVTKKIITKTTAFMLAAAMIITLLPMTVLNSAASAPALLMSLTRETATAAESGNKFTADGGVFADVSELTAWNNNEQITIGGTGRTPIVINNAAPNNNTGTYNANGFRSVSSHPFDEGITLDTATAFQVKFSTTGYDDIRFSATQKATGSGPRSFRLAYSIGSPTGPYTDIADSRVTVSFNPATDNYTDLRPSYVDFKLPDELNNKSEVYIRIYMVDHVASINPGVQETTTRGGNTSINDIRISSGIIPPEFGDRPDHIIINQVYGRAAASDSAVSRSFIELYNPTDTPVDMSGMSLQYFMGSDRGGPFGTQWEVLPLTGHTIASNSSLLVVGGSDYGTGGVRYTIENYDAVWNIPFSNRAFSIALVDGTNALSPNTTTNMPGLGGNAAIIDLVGVTNTYSNGDRAAFYELAPFDGISNQNAARRKDFADFNENKGDFESIRYAAPSGNNPGVSDERLEEVRPRSSHDGAWGADILPAYRVVQIPANQHLLFSETTGFYEDAFDLALSTGFTNGTIRYTLDGSEPTKDSAAYTAPIRIEDRTGPVNTGDVVGGFEDCTITIRGTGNDGNRVTLIKPLWREYPPRSDESVFTSEPISGGVFEIIFPMSAEWITDYMTDKGDDTGRDAFRIDYYEDVPTFSITDIIVTLDDDGTVLYDMQKDAGLNGWNNNNQQWGSITPFLRGSGGVVSVSGDGNAGTRAITITREPQQTWQNILFVLGGLGNQYKTGGDLAYLVDEYVPFGQDISKGTVIRAAVFDEGGNALTTSIHTQSYFVGLRDNYAGFPVISLSTDRDNLFDFNTGIYARGPGYIPGAGDPQRWENANFNQRGREWERPIHFEIIEPDGSTFAQDMGVRINGGWSRSAAQKSLRFYARTEYSPGAPTFKYDLFDGDAYNAYGEPITEFQRFILRQSGNDNHVAMMRDALLQAAAHDLNVARQSYRQAIVFINGEFWGYYDIRDRVDEYFYNDYIGHNNRRDMGYFQLGGWGHWPGEAEDVFEWVSCNEDCYRLYDESYCLGPVHWSDAGVRGDYESYLTMWVWFNNISGNMTDAQFLEAQRFIDLDNLLDYWAYCMVIGNADWPGNNFNIWRFRTDFPDTHEVTDYKDGRWRYNLRDLDFSYDIYNNGQHMNTLNYILNGNDYVTTLPLRKLMTNAAFRELFIARASDLMNTNAHASVMIPKIDEFASVIAPIMREQTHRWSNTDYSGWPAQVQRLRDFVAGGGQYATSKQTQFLGQMNTYFKLNGTATVTANNPDANMGYIRLNSIDIVTETEGVTLANRASWSGQYLRGSFQTVTAVPAEGYAFKQFTINGTVHASNTVRFNLAGNTTITVEFVEKADCGGDCIYPDAWIIRTPATTSAAGLEFKRCIYCDNEITREIPKLKGSSGGGGGGGGSSTDEAAPPANIVQTGSAGTIPPNFAISAATVNNIKGDLPFARLRITATGNVPVNLGTDTAGQNAVLTRLNADGELEVVN